MQILKKCQAWPSAPFVHGESASEGLKLKAHPGRSVAWHVGVVQFLPTYTSQHATVTTTMMYFHFEERLQATMSCVTFTEFGFSILCRHGRENNGGRSPLLQVSFIDILEVVVCLSCSETATSCS